ncbi:MAG: tRNA 4-thiouridine(8) synthase ThiI [Euryarchaeota archaeon]|nr:tRNA 4-thiouridine(8) synthase ThiI [Euryarchaeota archaeon]MBU4608772.1 tRNA 4-thiouridine(8) synthase ThiI [Euryarchaeota archaeon]MBV1755985.1 tRNA 4-thiouridine(8) synthase ThiI [Methanobacterium sp.]
MDYELVLLRYGEIGVKSPPVRKRFENRLIYNIKASLDCKIINDGGRLLLYTANLKKALQKIPKIFGIVSYSPAVESTSHKEDIKKTLQNYVNHLVEKKLFSGEDSFAIRARRVGEHDFTSQEIAAYCGSVVYEITSSPVDLSHPDFEVFVEVRGDKAFIYHEKLQGPGGLPVGTQGKVISLVSGGIDSPVATYFMMKRGCEVTILNFNNAPFTEPSEKVIKIVKKLKEYASGSQLKLYQVKYGPFLKKCQEEAPERMTCVLCKSGMYQVAGMLAKIEGALAIVDGSSLGQVASQTLPNILATRYSSTLPLLSPLIGLDKLEISAIGEKIGTFEISTLPDSGCKAVPRYPETNAILEKVLEVQEDIEMESSLREVYSTITRIEV